MKMLNAYLGALFPAAADWREKAKETMIEDLSSRHQRKAHAEAQQTSRVGDVGGLGDLLILHEPFGVRILECAVYHRTRL